MKKIKKREALVWYDKKGVKHNFKGGKNNV